jgi:hypothetical protein
MTTGSVDSGGGEAARPGSLLSAIWLPLSVVSIDLVGDANRGHRQVFCPRGPTGGGVVGTTRRGSVRAVSG